MIRFFSLSLLSLALITLPLFAQTPEATAEQDSSYFDLSLHHFLRNLRTHRVTTFSSNARFDNRNDPAKAFGQRIQGLSLVVSGSHETQLVSSVYLCIENPQSQTMSNRWLKLVLASLAVLEPNTYEVDRMLAVQRTLANDSHTFNSLTLSSSWDACGRSITITKQT
jgi:hypothetical protein